MKDLGSYVADLQGVCVGSRRDWLRVLVPRWMWAVGGLWAYVFMLDAVYISPTCPTF